MESAFFSAHSKQRGAALLIAIIILGLAATAYSLEAFKTASLQVQRDTNAAISLADAKAALLGYTFARVGAGERPGNMPAPDRLISPTESPPAGGPPNYDGQIDSCIGAGAAMHCLGRLPWQTLGISIPVPSQNDSEGTMPWYAVSANLLDPACLTSLNPGILNIAYTGYVCVGATLPHSWLTVRDSSGNIISNRVAVVLMLPGPPLTGQSRLSSPLGAASNYLDTVTVPVGCTAPCVSGTYSNADLDDDFIIASSISGSTAVTNDKLLFITIDELMQLLEKRVAQEVKRAIDYPNLYGLNYRPWLLPFNNPATWPTNYAWSATSGSGAGLIPFTCPTIAGCNSFNTEITWSIINPTVGTSSGTVDASTMSSYSVKDFSATPSDVLCQVDSNNAVNCTVTILAGLTPPVVRRTVLLRFNNTNSALTYTDADSSPNFKHAAKGINRDGAVNPVVTLTDFDSSNNQIGQGTIRTTGTSTILVRKLRLYPVLPDWYFENRWYEYMYAAIAPAYQPGGDRVCNSNAECLTVTENGNDRNNLQVVVMSAGRALDSTLFRPAPTYDAANPAQSRGSTNLYDYFDSANNISGGTLFDRQWPLSSTFNDQVIW